MMSPAFLLKMSLMSTHQEGDDPNKQLLKRVCEIVVGHVTEFVYDQGDSPGFCMLLASFCLSLTHRCTNLDPSIVNLKLAYLSGW